MGLSANIFVRLGVSAHEIALLFPLSAMPKPSIIISVIGVFVFIVLLICRVDYSSKILRLE